MSTEHIEALKLALEGAANYIDALGGDSRKYRQALAEQPAQRCPLCNYQHGHAIGCKNNPVDIALNKMAENARELGLDYDVKSDARLMEQPEQQEPVQRYSPDGEGGMEVDSLGAWMKFTSPQAQPARKPLTREQVKDLLFEAGYVGAEESADFINGLRHGEAAHGIKENT